MNWQQGFEGVDHGRIRACDVNAPLSVSLIGAEPEKPVAGLHQVPVRFVPPNDLKKQNTQACIFRGLRA